MSETIKAGAKLGSVLLSGIVLTLELVELFNGRSKSNPQPDAS